MFQIFGSYIYLTGNKKYKKRNVGHHAENDFPEMWEFLRWISKKQKSRLTF